MRMTMKVTFDPLKVSPKDLLDAILKVTGTEAKDVVVLSHRETATKAKVTA